MGDMGADPRHLAPLPRRGGAVARTDLRPGRAVFAWEFLRRNPDYLRLAGLQLSSSSSSSSSGDDGRGGPWGLRFLADPEVGGDGVVFWRPQAAQAMVAILEPAERDSGAALRLGDAACVRRASSEGLHLWFAPGVQALVRGGDLSVPLCAVLPLGIDFPARLKAVQGLHRVQQGLSPVDDLTTQQRRRLERALVALDGWRAGMSYRQIAESVFGGQAVSGAPWKTSSVRDCAIRLVRTGRGLMDGGYLRLLHPGGGPDPA